MTNQNSNPLITQKNPIFVPDVISENFFDHNFQRTIDLLPEIVCWKDNRSVFQGCNRALASLLNLQSPKCIIRKKATDLMAQNSHEIEADDNIALETRNIHVVTRTIHYLRTEERIITGKIIPLLDENEKPKGILCIGFLQEQRFFKNLDSLFDDIQPKKMHQLLKKNKFQIKFGSLNVSISKREAECLLYLYKGYPTKKIASEMNLAPRTVDAYIENIRGKMSVRTRYELISRTLNAEFLKCLGLNVS